MHINNKETRKTLRSIRKKYDVKMKLIFEAYAQYGDDFEAIENKIREEVYPELKTTSADTDILKN